MGTVGPGSVTGGDVTQFTSVDHTGDPAFFLHFLDAANNLLGLPWKAPILDHLRLQPSAQVLDAGCGVGTDAFEIANRLGPGGHVTAVDISTSLIAEASRRAAGRNLPISFEVGDAQALRFPDHAFDAVRTERMLMHVPDPEQALAEMARVLRPGGRMAVHDFDWETQFCDSPYKDVTRKIALSFCDGIRHGWIGRRLPRLFGEIGMSGISVSLYTITVPYDFLQLLLGGHVARAVATGVVTEDEANLWWTHLARANAGGTFLYGFTGFVVCGTRA